VRQRDVGAAAPLDEKIEHHEPEILRLHVLQLVVDHMVELAREQTMDKGRPAVADGMPEQHVAAGTGRY
jgi:hypothetical protein